MTIEAVKILESNNHSHMVPKLKKLIEVLKSSNLSRNEFIEISKQVNFLNLKFF